MNAKLYRHVYNKRLRCVVVAPEIAHSRVHGGANGVTASGKLPTLRPLGVALAMLLGGTLHAQTLPTGGNIVGGQGHIGAAGSTMTVQQNSSRLAINWNSFDIGAGNTVVFNQPSSSAVALNTVLGNNPSQIYGNLQANGQVFLINPNGVLFGKSAQVSVGGLFASTLPINVSAFMQGSGSYTFSRSAGSGAGQVINQGHLHAVNGGFVVLAANQVINSGTIDAVAGTVALASSDSVTLNLDNAGQLIVNVNAATLGALIQNQGLIEADGGQVLLTARGLDLLQTNVMNLSGVIQANTLGTKSGRIVMDGGDAAQGDSGMVALVNATISAMGAHAGEQGGAVTITGPHINLQGSAINVSGAAGGGAVLVGGEARGQGSLTHALTTAMDANSTIDASATRNGSGGTVVLWSDEETEFDGAILARGGMLGGHGGSVETSSKGLLGVQGRVDATAVRGTAGSWLLDPVDITVSSAPDSNYTPWFTPTGDPVTVNNGSLSNALQGGTSVTLDAHQGSGGSGSVIVAAPITSTGSGNLTLLSANGQNVTIGANISLGSGSFTAIGGNATVAGQAGGSVVLNTGDAITAANVTMVGGTGVAGVNGVNNNTVRGGVGTAGQAGGAGGSIVLNGTVTATNTATFTGGAGAYGGGGGSGSGYGHGGAGGAGGAGGSILVNANVNAGTVNVNMGAGSSGGGGGGAGWLAYASYAGGGPGGAGGAAGDLVLGSATVHATGTINVVGAIGGGGGGGGSGQAGYSGAYTVATAGTPGTATGGGHGGVSKRGSGGAGGAIGTNYGSGTAGAGGGYNGGVGGAAGAGGIIYANGNAFLTGGNVSFTTPTPIVINNNLTVNVTGSPNIANNTSGPGNFTQAGTGTTTLSGTNTYTGATYAQAGGLVLSDVAPGYINGNVNRELYTSAINISAGATVDINMGATNFTGGNGTAITGAGTLVKQGSGTMLLGNAGAGTTIAMSGTIEVASGALSNDYGNANWSNNTATMQVNAGAILELRNNNITVGALTGSGTVQNDWVNNTLTVGAGNGSGTFLGTITATPGATALSSGCNVGPCQVNLVKVGSGTQTLTGNNTYIGTTTVSGGTLQVGNGGTTGTLGTGAVTDNANLVINYSSAVNLSAVASNAAGITGTGNLTAISNGALGIDRAINLSSGNGSILLEAGAATSAGTASGGDVTATSNISAGASGTITVFSGDASTATLMAHMSGANGATDYKTYDASAGAVAGTVAGTRNFYYRVAPTETLANLTATKVYDGTTEAATAVKTVSVTGIDGDATTNLSAINVAAAVYNTSHAGTNLLITVPLSGNMTYTSGGQTWAVTGYIPSVQSASNPNINITPAPVTVTAATQTKAYDATTVSNAAVSNITGLLSGDSLTGLTQAYNSSQVQGTNGSLLIVNNSGVGMTGNHSSLLSDYAITYANTTGTITPAPVIVTASTQTKVFDTNTASNVAVTNITGLVSGDSLSGLTQAYNSSQVQGTNGSLLVVNSSGIGMSSNHSSTLSDYAITYDTTPGTITPAQVTVTAATDTKVYDGTTTSNQNVTNITGLLSGDNLTGLFQAYNSSQVQGTNGSLLVVSNSSVGLNSTRGDTLADYAVSYVSTPGTIMRASLTVTAAADTKTFDASTISTQNVTNITGLIPGDSLRGLFQAYNSSQVLGSNGSLLVVDGTGVSIVSNSSSTLNDYAISYISTPGTITPASVVVTAAFATKAYDTTTVSNQNVTNITGLMGGDTLTGLFQTYNNSQVLGADQSLLSVNSNNVGLSSSGDTLSDYTISYVSAPGTITPAPVTVTASTDTKVYDGTTASNATVTNISGLLTGDSLTGLFQDYSSPQVLGTNGSTLVVNSNGVAIASNHSSTLSDYAVTYVNATGSITPRDLIIDLNNITKAYDGTSVAYTSGGVAEPATATTGLLPGDTIVSITGNGTYNSPHALSANAANFSLANVAIDLSGKDLANYHVTLVQPARATIIPVPVSVTATSQTKMYDGTTASNAVVTNVSGMLPGDSLAGLTQAYTNPNALGTNGSTLVVNGGNAGVTGDHGSLLSDYTVNYFTSTGTITPALTPTPVPPVIVPPAPTPNVSPSVRVAQSQGAVRAAQYMTGTTPPPWLTITQSPQSAQMLEVANTGQPPSQGPVNVTVTAEGVSITGLYCVQGAIRVPEGLNALPVENCGRLRRTGGI